MATTNLLVLHTLRCGGYASVSRLAATTGQTESEVESDLIDLGVEGLVTRVDGSWGLTEAGRAADTERVAAELESAGARSMVNRALKRFLALNPELLDLSAAWQLRPVEGASVLNDHSDAEYDARVLTLFENLDRRVAPILAELSEALPRFSRYRIRLAEALQRAGEGELAYVADGTASYHAVWAELHEDLLVTLGMPRWTR